MSLSTLSLLLPAMMFAAEPNTAPDDSYQLLFTGKDLQHWISDPDTLEHWIVREGIIHADGKGGNLVTEDNYRDFELMLEWRIQAGSSGGVFVRGRPKVAITDGSGEEGSGGLVNNKVGPNKPSSKEDKPAGEWNTLKIKAVNNKVTVHVNEKEVVAETVMENAFDSSRKLPVNGKIELEADGPIEFRSIYLKKVEAGSSE